MHLNQTNRCCAREQSIYATPLDLDVSLEFALAPPLRRWYIKQDRFKE
jgi:hypothetical protein